MAHYAGAEGKLICSLVSAPFALILFLFIYLFNFSFFSDASLSGVWRLETGREIVVPCTAPRHLLQATRNAIHFSGTVAPLCS